MSTSLSSLVGDACETFSRTGKSQVKLCEERIRCSPIPSVFLALGAGWLLQALPLRGIFSNLFRVILALIKPMIMIYGITKISSCLAQKCEVKTEVKPRAKKKHS